MDAEIIADYETDKLQLVLSTGGTGALNYSTVGEAGDSSGEASNLWAALTSGQGVYDEAPPVLHDEDDELDALDLVA